MKSTTIQGWFREHHGVMTTKELMNYGVTYYSIRKLLLDGVIYKIKRGIYGVKELSENENTLIDKLIPKGIYCLQSAAFIHDYTMDIPLRYHIAVHNKANHNLPDYPPIKLHYWKDQQLTLGEELMELNGLQIKVYDKEKTVCDYFKFRNKLDSNSIKEVTRSYLRDKDRDLVKLKNYSKQLKVSTVLDRYLEVLV